MSLATMTFDLPRPAKARSAGEPALESGIAANEASSAWDMVTVYWAFVIATPFLLVIFEYARTASSDLEWPETGLVFWRAIAAGVAFAIWGLSVPSNTYQAMLGGVAFTGLMAVSISPILTAIDAIVMRVIRDRKAKRKD